jgi:hypothetical protein
MVTHWDDVAEQEREMGDIRVEQLEYRDGEE